jgi:hypothetical protein
MKKTFTSICIMLLSITALLAQNKKETTLNISSFNLRMDTQSDGVNAWPNRKEMVKGLIRFHELDIIGTQEGFRHQLDDIREMGGYAYVGGGRDDGKDAGEHCSTRVIFGFLKHLHFRARDGMPPAATVSAHGQSSGIRNRERVSSFSMLTTTTRERRLAGIHH